MAYKKLEHDPKSDDRTVEVGMLLRFVETVAAFFISIVFASSCRGGCLSRANKDELDIDCVF